MDVFCCRAGCGERVGSIFFQRKFQREGGAAADGAFHLYFSMVRIHDRLYITEAEAKALYIMQVAGMGAVEFFKDPALGLLCHADAVVFDADDEAL